MTNNIILNEQFCDFKNYMKRHSITNMYGDSQIPNKATHLSLKGDKGKYYIPENELTTFFDKYEREIKSGRSLGILEKPISHMKVSMMNDIDIKYTYNTFDEEDMIKMILNVYVKYIRKYIKNILIFLQTILKMSVILL